MILCGREGVLDIVQRDSAFSSNQPDPPTLGYKPYLCPKKRLMLYIAYTVENSQYIKIF